MSADSLSRWFAGSCAGVQPMSKVVKIGTSRAPPNDHRILTMTTTRLAALVLIVVGGGLLYFGFSASGSAFESITETVTGRYSDRTTMYLVGGAVCAVVGASLLLFGKK